MDKDPKESQEYFNDMEEWQRNQYIPGHYTGGKIPPAIKYSGKKYFKTIFIFGAAAIVFIIIIAILTQ